MEEEKCVTCLYFDPEYGLCVLKDEVKFASESCEDWQDWEMEYYGGRKREKPMR